MKLRRVAIALIALQVIGAPVALAATTKPTPKVTSVKKAPVATQKSTATPKKIAVAKKTVVAPKKTTVVKKSTTSPKKSTTTKKSVVTPKKSAAGTVKKTATIKKKAPVRKYVYHAPVRKAVTPSPSAAWPPKGFTSVGTAYARVPTGTELIGILSAMKNSASPVNSCSTDPTKPASRAFSCAAILVGSTQRCTWWKVSAAIDGIDPANPAGRIPFGEITDVVAGAAAKTIQTIFLVSPIPLQTGVRFTGIHALCGIGPATDPVPSSTFAPDPSYTPTPSATPSPTSTNP